MKQIPLILAFMVGVATLLATPVLAAVPQVINVQGKLADVDGNPLPGGFKKLYFKIWDAQSGGVEVWPSGPIDSVITTSDVNGLWNAEVGSVIPLTESVFSDTSRWLEIRVDDGLNPPEILPRFKFTATAFTFHSAKSDQADDAALFAGQPPSAYSVVGHTHPAASGWVDDGAVVRLETSGDLVGMGLSSPTEKLDIVGGLRVRGKANIGMSNSNTGDQSFVAGQQNAADGVTSTISGGWADTASGLSGAIGGGERNRVRGERSAIAGGVGNEVTGHQSVIAGGDNNHVGANYSAILGGLKDTITSTAHYSYLFGIDATLTQDSTFMVDMPHVRIGDEATGYELPTTDGTSGQVLTTDGAGQTSWSTPAGDGTGIIPVGAVVAWMKNMTGVPSLSSNFVECNGQVLSDAGSPLNGVTIPNLNGFSGESQRFLRGSLSSGALGGAESHSHGTTTLTTGDQNTPAFTDPAGHLPPYYEVVWVIRVK